MLLVTLVSPVFGANCYLVAPQVGGRCVIVDPGAGVHSAVAEAVREHRLEPMAVLATHGHVDHTWDAQAVCETFGVPLRLHAADAYRLADPLGALPPVSAALTSALAAVGLDAADYRPPTQVEIFDGEDPQDLPVDIPELPIRAVPAPGHTEGSTLYLLDRAPTTGQMLGRLDGAADVTRTVLTGDVLFAGTIGRTDLPGGDDDRMARTLRDVVGALPADTLVLPGHGPATTMAAELVRNPFLARG